MACQTKTEVPGFDMSEGILVKITNPAGENAILGDLDFLPPPFNIGEFENNKYRFIVLSDRVKKGKAVRVRPIARVELMDTILKEAYIVAIPVDTSKRIMELESYGELATEYTFVKYILENWLKATAKHPYVDIEWKSEQSSLDLMN